MENYEQHSRTGQNILKYIEHRKYSKTHFAKRIVGITGPTLNKLITGESPDNIPFEEHIRQITDTLLLPQNYFLEEPDYFRATTIFFISDIMSPYDDSRVEILNIVEKLFNSVGCGIKKWESNWGRDEIFDNIIFSFELLMESFRAISLQKSKFNETDAISLNKRYLEMYEAILTKSNEYDVKIPWSRSEE